MFKKILKKEFFITNIILPLATLILYCVSYAFFSSRVLPEGVNFYFVNRLWKYLLLVLVVLCFLYFMILKLINNKSDKLALKFSIQKISVRDLLLLLLPLTPVVQYIINNQDILSPTDLLSILVFFVLFSCLFIFVIPIFLGNPNSTQTMKLLGLAFVVTITSMSILSQYFSWYEKGSLKIQLLFFGGVFLVAWLLYYLKNKWILLFLIAAIFVSNSTIQVLTQEEKSEGPSLPISENKLLSLVEGRMPEVSPNIYLLIYDAYAPSETMLGYGIDNSDQEKYLSGQGFTLYPHTYSVETTTVNSMSRVLNVSRELYGKARRGVSGDGIVHIILKNLGYTTYGVFYSDFMFRGIGSSYDFSIPERSTPSNRQFISAILIGEFKFDFDFNEQSHDQFVETKESVLKSISGNKAFVYMHTNLPLHSQNSGVCLSNETELFNARLTRANLEMRKDIKTITDSDPEAIIIVAGDHGPYLTKNCIETSIGKYDISDISRLDIQDRFGTFLAIRWPTGDYTKYDDITVLQDLFPAIFAYIYKDESILESKMKPVIQKHYAISYASVKDGIIYGGINNGESLFLSGK